VRRLLTLANKNHTAGHIATKFSCSRQAVVDKADDIGLQLYGNNTPTRKRAGEAARMCLKCKHDFLSSAAGNRICPICISGVNNSRCNFEAHYLAN